MTDDPSVWRIERYDHAWAGWRPVPQSFDSDDPALYADEEDAERDAITLTSRTTSQIRIHDLTTGQARVMQP